MLVLARKPNEAIILEAPNLKPITITVLENGRIGIDAPAEVQIVRNELLQDSTG